eukprot:TRINITY_DN3405_c0_g1_i1.p1 TRINITY_DN3405_c0_g1~~TRINITY_DN3405_c0_g1_i1.p1  ORF type:complete len:351 (-),score=30.92 TRINITY_DN3405_c0_g1_i1:88-1140(-)
MFWTLSRRGYLYDKNHAFFPLLPFIISCTRSLMSALFSASAESLTLIVCIAIGNAVFVLSVVVFYKLALVVVGVEKHAYRATVMYIFNPAAVYFTVVYNESYYALFSILGMYLCHTAKSFHKIIWGSLCFALATSCRSNGAILLLFCAYSTFRLMFSPSNLSNFFKGVLTGLTCLFIVVFTFFTLDVYVGYETYCKNTVKVPEWCNKLIPDIYSYVQEKYWQVGFLRTLLGKERVFQSAMWFSIPFNVLGVISLIQLFKQHRFFKIIPYAIYFLLLMLTVALIANAEINTRVCASVPVVYWVYGRWQVEADENYPNRGIWDYVKKYIYVVYASIYFIVEILLVPTFIGWI